ncbi:MAG TPA: HlyD family efflux transporter periplasmic adaptor subunit [Gemmatimonadaceae bacterium]
MSSRRPVIITTAIVAAAVVGGAIAHFERARGVDLDEVTPSKPPSRVVRLGDEAAIVLGSEAATRADIGTTPLSASGGGGGPGSAGTGGVPSVRLSGELAADPARGATIRAAVPGRLSSNEWPALDSRVSAGQLLGRVSDAAPMTAPRGGTVIHVGAQPGELVQAGQELLVLADFRALLARVVWRPELGSAPPAAIAVAPLSGMTPGSVVIRAQLIGAAAGVDSLTRMPVYLYRLAGAWPGGRPGTPVIATTSDGRAVGDRTHSSSAASGGVVVPDAAVVQWEGLAWAFVERGPRSYVRERVMTDNPVTGGYIVTSASSRLEPGDLVVTRGAQQLLSEEFRTHVQMSDEGDEK